jgi:hypothetical protein
MEQAIIFIYAKDKKIKALTTDLAEKSHHYLIKDGWEHTKTINACIYIQYLYSISREEIANEIASLAELN